MRRLYISILGALFTITTAHAVADAPSTRPADTDEFATFGLNLDVAHSWIRQEGDPPEVVAWEFPDRSRPGYAAVLDIAMEPCRGRTLTECVENISKQFGGTVLPGRVTAAGET